MPLELCIYGCLFKTRFASMGEVLQALSPIEAVFGSGVGVKKQVGVLLSGEFRL